MMNLRRGLVRFFRYPQLWIGSLIILAFAVVALGAPLIAPPAEENPFLIPRDGFKPLPQSPGPGHPLGTMADQYDVFYGLVWGTQVAFRVGLSIVLGRLLLGILLGLLSGYYGGWLDRIVMRITDAFMAFPVLVAAVVIMALFGQSRFSYMDSSYYFMGSTEVERMIIVTLVLFGWMQFARLMRGNMLAERAKEYVEAAVALGLPNRRIIFRHLLPNVTGGLFVLIASDIGAVVVLMSVLNYLGLTSNPGGAPSANWGEMLAASRHWIIGSGADPWGFWHTYVPPAVAIILFSVGWHLIGDGLRNALDPRLRQRISQVQQS